MFTSRAALFFVSKTSVVKNKQKCNIQKFWQIGRKRGIASRPFTETITLPSSQEIHKRLNSIGMGHFTEETGFHDKIGGKELSPIGVYTMYQFAFVDYSKNMGNSAALFTASMMEDTVFKKILEESPKALEEIKEFKKQM